MKRLLVKQSGAALVYVIMVFAVLMILLASVAMLYTSNNHQARHQEQRMKAYYLALSGVDMTKSTLLTPLYIDAFGQERNMVDGIKADVNKHDVLTDTLTIDGHTVTIHVRYNAALQELTIESQATLISGITSDLTLKMNVATSNYSERWD